MQLAFPLGLKVRGIPTPGAKPVFTTWQLVSTGTKLTPPLIFDKGSGIYVYYWDAEAYGDAIGVVDWGPVAFDPNERYDFAVATRESGHLLSLPIPPSAPK